MVVKSFFDIECTENHHNKTAEPKDTNDVPAGLDGKATAQFLQKSTHLEITQKILQVKKNNLLRLKIFKQKKLSAKL